MNLEKTVLDFFNGLTKVDFNSIIYIVIFALVLFWLFVVAWVWFDSGERVEKTYARILASLWVLIFNIPGLLIYLMLRPKMTLSEQFWSDLERRYLLYETAELNDCENCGEMLKPGFVFCPNCKCEVKVRCSNCGLNIDKSWKMCPHCGDVNSAYAEVPATPKTERKNKNIKYESFGEFLSRKVNETKTKYQEKKKEKESKVIDAQADAKSKKVEVNTLEKDSKKVKSKNKKNKRKNRR